MIKIISVTLEVSPGGLRMQRVQRLGLVSVSFMFSKNQTRLSRSSNTHPSHNAAPTAVLKVRGTRMSSLAEASRAASEALRAVRKIENDRDDDEELLLGSNRRGDAASRSMGLPMMLCLMLTPAIVGVGIAGILLATFAMSGQSAPRIDEAGFSRRPTGLVWNHKA